MKAKKQRFMHNVYKGMHPTEAYKKEHDVTDTTAQSQGSIWLKDIQPHLDALLRKELPINKAIDKLKRSLDAYKYSNKEKIPNWEVIQKSLEQIFKLYGVKGFAQSHSNINITDSNVIQLTSGELEQLSTIANELKQLRTESDRDAVIDINPSRTVT